MSIAVFLRNALFLTGLILAISLSQSAASSAPIRAQAAGNDSGNGLPIHLQLSVEFSPKASQALPLKSPKGVIVVSGSVNGHAANILVDTGAQVSFIDRSLIASPLPQVGTEQSRSAAKRVYPDNEVAIPGAMTASGTFLSRDLKSVSRAAGIDIGAIVGAEILKNALIFVDPTREYVYIAPRGALRPTGKQIAVPLYDGAVRLSLGGTMLSAIVDTGSEAALTLSASKMTQYQPTSGWADDAVRHMDVDGNIAKAQRSRQPEPVRIGDFAGSLIVSRSALFDLPTGIGAAIGLDAFKGHSVLIDLGDSKLSIGN